MARGTQPLTNFTAGELSPLLDIRQDIAKYRNGANKIRNAIVMPHGGARKRPGTLFIQPVKTHASQPRLVPFRFNIEQSYMLEFGAGYIRFYKDQAIITDTARVITNATAANPVVITSNGHGFSNGDQVIISGVVGMTQLNNRRYTVANQAANTFELSGINGLGFTAYSSGGEAVEPIEITNTYAADELEDLSFAQSADTLYIAHVEHPLRSLTRTSHTSWTLAEVDVVNGPFRPINADKTHYFYLDVRGSAVLQTASRTDPVAVTFTGAHGFGEGATIRFTSVNGMTQLNGNAYMARNVSLTQVELWTQAEQSVDGGSFGAYTSGGFAITSSTPFGTISPGSPINLYSTDAVFQTAHVGALFRLWAPGQALGDGLPTTGVTMVNNQRYVHDEKVYGLQNVNFPGTPAFNANFNYPAHEEGVVRVLDAGDASKYFDSVYLHDGSFVAEVTGTGTVTNVPAIVVRNHVPAALVLAPAGAGGNAGDRGGDTIGTRGYTSLWEEGAWSAVRGYPRAITLHRGRLWAASSEDDPQFVWASRVNDFEDFQDGADDNDAIVAQVSSDTVEIARWLLAGNTLLLGTVSGEHAIAASSQNQAVTPSNIQVVPQTPYGSARMRPIRAGDAILFAQRNGDPDNAGQRLREALYNDGVAKYVAPNLSILSEHIAKLGLIKGAFQAEPDPVAWMALENGQLAGLTYETEQDVKGWHLHDIGGTDTEVEDVACIPGADGDELWLLIARTIGGSTVRYIEVMTTGLRNEDEKEDAVYLDGALSYNSTATNLITGLWHLEGQSVQVLADGSKLGPYTVATGRITLSATATMVHAGLSFETVIESIDLDGLAQAGTAKSRPKRINRVYMDVYRSLGGRAGPDEDNLHTIVYRGDSDPFGSSPDLRTQLVEFDFPSGWDRVARIRVEHDEPYPFTLLGHVADLETVG